MNDGTNVGAYAALILAVYLGVFAFSIAIALLAYVALGLTLSRFFRKVGVEPWIAWVPFYNRWKWLEVGGHPGWLSLLSLVPYGATVSLIFLAIGNYRTGIAFGKDGSWVVLGLFLPWVWCYLLSRDSEVYEPGRTTAAGYPAPLAGFGAAPR